MQAGNELARGPQPILATSPIRDMIRMLATTYGLSVTSTAYFADRRHDRPHYIRHHVHRPARIAPSSSAPHLMFRRIGVHPIIRGPGFFLFRRADVRQMFRSGHVIRTAAVQIAIRVSLLVQQE